MNETVNIKFSKSTVKWLAGVLVVPGGGYLSYDKLWEPYRKIQNERALSDSLSSLRTMEKMTEISNYLKDIVFNQKVLQYQKEGYSLDDAVILTNE